MPWTLNIPKDGDSDALLFNSVGCLVAIGFERVVEGERGPYVEFHEDHIQLAHLVTPPEEEWRKASPSAYYEELRTNDTAWVKVYKQRRSVGYADYVPGLYYISPFDLEDEGGERCAEVVTDG